MKEIVPVIKDLLTKVIIENAIRKLEKIPEPECSQFVAATKARFLAERDNSIRRRLAAAKIQEPIMQGHDLSGKERFRFYLSDEGCRNAKHSEQEGEIKIKSHAAVAAGSVLRTADDFHRFSICSNHHRGSCPFPALAYVSCPFVDLQDGITLHCKLFPPDKFSEIRLYFFYEIAYNRASDKSVFERKKTIMERPILNKDLDSQTFREYYFLKEELVNFCGENGLPASGGKLEITDRLAYFLDTGKVLSAPTKRKRTTTISDIYEDTEIEENFVCSEKHRAFLESILEVVFRSTLLFKNR